MQVGTPPYEHRPGWVFTSDAACDDYDWLVVYDEMDVNDVGTLKGGVERLRCPRERTVLATCEPVSIKTYSRAYTRQFGHLLTNRPYAADPHPGYFPGRGYYMWLTERSHPMNVAWKAPAKRDALSVVCSAKKMTHTKHGARFRLVSEVAKAIPGTEWYGHGVRECPNKCAALDPCKYHLAVENHVAPHHWSEKIADALLCGCLPFYAGAPDLADDLPAESFIPVPIDDPPEAIRIIRAAMAADEYSRRREAVEAARRLLLERFNFWDQVIELAEASRDQAVTAPGPDDFVMDRKLLRRHRVSAALEDGWYHLKQYLHLA